MEDIWWAVSTLVCEIEAIANTRARQFALHQRPSPVHRSRYSQLGLTKDT
jgi:hypothetical protein